MLLEKNILKSAIQSNKFSFDQKSYKELENYMIEKIKYISEIEKISNLNCEPLYYFSWISNENLNDCEREDLFILTEKKLNLLLKNGSSDNTGTYFSVPSSINKCEDV